MTWWLQEGWTAAACGRCGAKIWPEGDPDWGLCYSCFSADVDSRQHEPPLPRCDICGEHQAVAGSNGYGVCSAECAHEADTRVPA